MNFFARIGAALDKIRSNAQLLYTVAIAIVIVLAFVFMASRFIGIATDAQDRLVNVRVGSLQDAFVSFAVDRLGDTEYLDARIAEVMRSNKTIERFRVVQKQVVFRESTTTAIIVIASNDPQEIGNDAPEAEFLYTLASSDPSHSITTETSADGTRAFHTARAVVDQSGDVRAVVLTTQTLSEADKAIERDITNSIYVLIAIIVLILALFLRHSRIVDYMDLYRRLKDVDQLKDDLISMASHELRTPLSIVRGYADMLRLAPELSEESKLNVTRIDDASKNLDALIADMLDVSRIEQGRMQFKFETLAPRAFVETIVGSFSTVAQGKGLALSFDASKADDTQRIEVDPDRLKQVLVNLIGNAIKYTPKGEVQVSQYAENGRLYIRIRDTGLGISAENREKLFQKFYRVKSEQTASITGTGLGLWITAQLVSQMRGTISVESIVGVGSHFIVSFALAKQP